MPVFPYRLTPDYHPIADKFFFLISTLAFFFSPTLALAASFYGYQCQTQECSGHHAGYTWAEENSITDPYGCNEGQSQSFIEGCEAYTSDVHDYINDNDDEWEE